MTKANEIIVYRSPMEKAVYDFWMEDPTGIMIVQGLGYLFLAAVICFIVYIAWQVLVPKKRKF